MGAQNSRMTQNKSFGRRILSYSILIVLAVLFSYGIVFLVTETYRYVYEGTPVELASVVEKQGEAPFPIGVSPGSKAILEQPNVEAYLEDELARDVERESTKTSLVRKTIGKLALMGWYQNLAAGTSRILIIEPGERKEQVASHFGKILGWTDDEKREFLTLVITSEPLALEGKFTPGTYVVGRGAKPADVAPLIIHRFEEEVIARYPEVIAREVPLNDALTIASLLEREAYDFTDMREIAGVIWNRLFIDMNLQIDATLQYARGSESTRSWWPQPVPRDKYVDSPYNTYEHSGLPPTPIANPGPAAILAALNPRVTECLYYFHDRDGGFHCAETYEEHVALLKKHYGRGK